MIARTYAEPAPESEALKTELQAELTSLREQMDTHRHNKEIAELTVAEEQKAMELVEAKINVVRRKIAILDKDEVTVTVLPLMTAGSQEK